MQGHAPPLVGRDWLVGGVVEDSMVICRCGVHFRNGRCVQAGFEVVWIGAFSARNVTRDCQNMDGFNLTGSRTIQKNDKKKRVR